MVKLIIEDDEGKTTVVPLIRDEITIGRKEGNTIRLTERNVSRRHAKLVKQNGALFIEDLNSYNGIKVNGNKIAGRVAVTEGDRIQIGDYVLGLKLEGVVVEAVAPAAPASAATPPTSSDSARTMELPRPSEAPTAVIEVDEAKAEIEAAAPPPPPKAAPAPLTAETAGRLVCVSTNFPGKEWLLDRAVSVIGRTEDNDVVVNHRSISRHHARIMEENGRHTIVDLQSSNGVRVNGEEYGKVELRRGDLIDLGHVRLRFVAPGEDFVFARDASVVDISKGGGGRAGIWAAVILVAAAGIGFAVWKLGLVGGGKPTASVDGQTGATGTGAGQGSATGADSSRILQEIAQGMQGEQWGEVIAACEKLGAAQRARAASCEKARKEKEAKQAFDDAHSAFMLNKPEEVIRLRKQIPDESVYKKRDPEELEKARAQLVAKLRTQLDDLVAQRPCDKDRSDDLVRQIKELDPSNTEAEATAKKCKAAVAIVPPDIKKTPKKIVVVVPKKETKKEPPVDEAALAQLLQQAQNLFVNGQHSRARELARQVIRSKPNHQNAISLLGACSCAMKDKVGAKWAYERLAGGSKNSLKQICQNQYGIALD